MRNPKPTGAIKIMHQEIANRGQDTVLTELYHWGDRRLKVSIRSDSYREQSHARIYVWSGGKWSEVAHIDPYQMVTPVGSDRYSPGMQWLETSFSVDRKKLLELAIVVLG